MKNFFKRLEFVLLVASAIWWMGVVLGIFAPNIVPSDQFIDVLAWAVGVSVVWCVVYLYNKSNETHLEPQYYEVVGQLTDVNLSDDEAHNDWLAGITNEDKEDFRRRLGSIKYGERPEADYDSLAQEYDDAEFEADNHEGYANSY